VTTTGSARHIRSACPIATTLDVVGDKWSLLIVRDLVMGKTRFSEFLASPENVTTNILADRLKRLESEGLVDRTLYQERPNRYAYRLTEKGRALVPVLQAICRWANDWRPETYKAPDSFMSLEV
jgi:DNA-binding HxlR family transcriptional regulator